MPTSLLLLLFTIRTMFCSCQPDQRRQGFQAEKRFYRLEKLGKIEGLVNESSGLATATARPTFYTHNDSGGEAALYELDLQGHLLQTLPIPGALNHDWEDLSRDPMGNLYIGDTGNNAGPRKEFVIYKVPEAFLSRSNPAAAAEAIRFRYPGPARDCEAFFYANDSLYLFTKARRDSTTLFVLPAQPGSYVARQAGQFYLNGIVTSADISPDRRQFALLTYGKVFVFGINKQGIGFNHPLACRKVNRKQAEALVYLNNTDLLISNEQRGLYRLSRNK